MKTAVLQAEAVPPEAPKGNRKQSTDCTERPKAEDRGQKQIGKQGGSHEEKDGGERKIMILCSVLLPELVLPARRQICKTNPNGECVQNPNTSFSNGK